MCVISPFLALLAPIFGLESAERGFPKKSTEGYFSTLSNIDEASTGIAAVSYTHLTLPTSG